MKFQVYIDAGTTNSRLYLLNEMQECIVVKKSAIGAKDSAKAYDGDFHIKALYGLYSETLEQEHISNDEVESICLSGMVTSKYGIHEAPHCLLPVSAEEFSKKLIVFPEKHFFCRDLILVPGIKQSSDEFEMTGLARGEEIELFGMMDVLQKEYGNRTVAVAMPGSHTHVAFVCEGRIVGLCSNITGEIYYAIKESTVLAPVLNDTGSLDAEWVSKGVIALRKYGFTRALYLPHTMNMLNHFKSEERRSFTEGVIFGGIVQSVEYYVEKLFPECDTLLIAASGEVGELYHAIFSSCAKFSMVKVLPEPETAWALQGYRNLMQIKEAEACVRC